MIEITQIQKKRKILMISDHAGSSSGVGCQSRYLINGLIEKGTWSFRQFGAALKHENYDIVKVSDDLIIRPIDGFGDRDSILLTLATEKPDVLLIFTDPRFFIWLYEMEDEIHKVCPIAYWHVWDNLPYPAYNKVLYEATDLINCHSHLTYEMVHKEFPDRTNFIPHTLPQNLFFPFAAAQKTQVRTQILGKDAKNFNVLWINRNARRKRPGDVLWAWQKFLHMIAAKYDKSDATLIMHTDPLDQEGPNLFVIAEMLGIKDNVIFSTERVEFEKMNALHNSVDACVNISYAEGFGLSTLEAMQCGNPIIALKTGGLTRQVVDHRDGSENGIALPVEMQSLVGSQLVPYIYEDYVTNDTVALAFLKMYEMGPSGREILGQKARDYVLSEFNHAKMIDDWDKSLNKLVDAWKTTKKLWSAETL